MCEFPQLSIGLLQSHKSNLVAQLGRGNYHRARFVIVYNPLAVAALVVGQRILLGSGFVGLYIRLVSDYYPLFCLDYQ